MKASDAAFGRNAPNSYILPQETPQNKQVHSDSCKYLQATLSKNGRWIPVCHKNQPCRSSTLKEEDPPPPQLTVATCGKRILLHLQQIIIAGYDGCVITMKSCLFIACVENPQRRSLFEFTYNYKLIRTTNNKK